MQKNSPYDIVKHLMMTEKSALLKEENKYAFKVAVKATKLEIAAAVQEIYGVKVKSVNILNFMGKLKRVGRSPIPGRRSSWKKAVALPRLSRGTRVSLKKSAPTAIRRFP